MCRVSISSGSPNLLEPSGHVETCNGTASPCICGNTNDEVQIKYTGGNLELRCYKFITTVFCMTGKTLNITLTHTQITQYTINTALLIRQTTGRLYKRHCNWRSGIVRSMQPCVRTKKCELFGYRRGSYILESTGPSFKWPHALFYSHTSSAGVKSSEPGCSQFAVSEGSVYVQRLSEYVLCMGVNLCSQKKKMVHRPCLLSQQTAHTRQAKGTICIDMAH